MGEILHLPLRGLIFRGTLFREGENFCAFFDIHFLSSGKTDIVITLQIVLIDDVISFMT